MLLMQMFKQTARPWQTWFYPSTSWCPANVKSFFRVYYSCWSNQKIDWSRPYSLSHVRRIVETGHIVPETSPKLQPFVQCYTELSVLEGRLLRGSRIFIPPQGRKTILSQLHDTHPSITRMKHLARAYVWWPGLDKEIEPTVKNCNICQINRVSPPKNIIHLWECPPTPWTRVHVDHARPFLGKYYFILVDAFSWWIEVDIIDSTSATSTINVLHKFFSTHGLPKQLVPAFTSNEFRVFVEKNGICHSLTSPYCPCSNGLAEQALQTFKSAMKKLEGPINMRISRFLLRYCVTRQSTTGLTPSELLMGRRLRTIFDLIHPDLSDKIEQKQSRFLNLIKKFVFSLQEIKFMPRTTWDHLYGYLILLWKSQVLNHTMWKQKMV